MIRGMTTAPLCMSISHNFIVQMLPHHRAAIQMSKNLLSFSNYKPLRDIASQIITGQTESIHNMEKIKGACSLVCNCAQNVRQYQAKTGQILDVMFTRMRQAPATNNIDRDFIVEMIPHHRGAVEMSKNALTYPICPPLRPILQAIITSQERGIAQMEQLERSM